MTDINLTGIKGHSRQLSYISKLAENDSYPHAFLFSGPAGIGKRLIAERFLGSLFCRNQTAPCFSCDICRQIKAGSFPDYLALMKDEKGKIPVGDRDKAIEGSVRWLIDKLGRSSISGKFGIIIDGVDTISETGQNALLKTIEEPPPGTIFVLIAESSSLILPTIVSRCLEITFNPLPDEDVQGIIESLFPESGQGRLIAAIAGGSVESALYLNGDGVLDEVFELCRSITDLVKGKNRYFNVTNSINEKGNEILLTVLINIFSYMLKESYMPGINLLPRDIYIDSEDDLRDVIKILLKVKKGLNNNLNVKNSLKGMLYNFSGSGERAITGEYGF
jgi:DNA polymerase-3 subunit delta'